MQTPLIHEDLIHEQVEAARDSQQKGIGLTTAVVAVFLAVATMLANDANTDRIVVETKTAHWWAFTHSNDTNSRMYMATERLAQLHGEDGAAHEFHELYVEQKKESESAGGQTHFREALERAAPEERNFSRLRESLKFQRFQPCLLDDQSATMHWLSSAPSVFPPLQVVPALVVSFDLPPLPELCR